MSDHQSAERRRHERRPVELPGQLIIGDQSDKCVVFDISAGGAVVTSPVGPAPDQSVRLKLTEKGEFSGTVVWCREDRIGIRFDYLDDHRLGL